MSLDRHYGRSNCRVGCLGVHTESASWYQTQIPREAWRALLLVQCMGWCRLFQKVDLRPSRGLQKSGEAQPRKILAYPWTCCKLQLTPEATGKPGWACC